MRKKEFIIIFLSIAAIGFFTCIFLFAKKEVPSADTVMINKLVKLTEQNWDKLSGDIYPVSGIDFTVIDNSGRVLYNTGKLSAASYVDYINTAAANYDIILDIRIEQQPAGKMIIHNNSAQQFRQKRLQLRNNILICYLTLVFLMLAYFFYLERKLLRPFRSLQSFAASVAAGNLDAPIQMDRKNVFGAFTESFDLMRDALQTARKNEYLANKSKKELVASLSHDIKNPVASIKAMCETMALDLKDIRILNILQKAEQIDSLISDMFQSTLEELGELKVVNEEYGSEILYDIVKGINYYNKIQVISPLPECLIVCDRLRLTQVLDNLISNSYKYAGTEITISYELSEGYLIIRIKDFGAGVPDNELPMICEKFYRGKNSEGKEGAGLGLYLSRLFVEKMGGQIEFMNDTDGFVVVLGIKTV